MNILLTFILFCLLFLAMAIGLIFSKKPLKKGCGQDPDNPESRCTCQGNGGECEK